MNRTIILITLIAVLSPLSAQQLSPVVLSSNGGTDSAKGVQLEWTLGELATRGVTGQPRNIS